MCCSLEIGVRVIGWLQVASGVMLILFSTVALITELGTNVEPELVIDQGKNLTVVEIKEETIQRHKEHVAAKTLSAIVLIIFMLFYFFMIGIAGALLTGIRKRKPKLVWTWIVVNGVGCCLAASLIFFELMSMLLATDPGSLTNQITWLVLNTLQVWVVYNYYQEMKDGVLPAY
ncbi:uncharacterized protein [Halyomorpha halys]|uniref:uncharacterized protein n=1 Tax=Halyomorpha halys TaxID=286706 RepID=UPI0006D4D0A6|nr:uncharacterized protein LOC106690992 [Halyomorpha halys]XP_014292114.1 uncharacterized protein LOC106690992 [Halyomorpha halys]